MSKRIEKLTHYMNKKQIDFIYLDDPQTVAYFTDFESNPHERIVALFVLQDKSFLFVPQLEEKEAKDVSTIQEVITYKDEQNPWVTIKQELNTRLSSCKKIGTEENTLSVERYKALQQIRDQTDFVDIRSFLQEVRLVKNSDEISRMKVAGEIADQAIQIGISKLKEGIAEQEVVAEIEYELKKRGISEMSFPTMVLFGDHAGSPHGNPGDRKLQQGELVLFDLGVVKEGYTSDITRTVAFGEVSSFTKEIYEIVYSAQKKAQQAVKPGVTAEELDFIARNYIEEAGYGKYFTHRLGHGLGKSVHEYPSLAKGNDLVLEKGMCFSIEPGIYIPGEVGVRIEDCVYVTESGCESFTSITKKLTVV